MNQNVLLAATPSKGDPSNQLSNFGASLRLSESAARAQRCSASSEPETPTQTTCFENVEPQTQTPNPKRQTSNPEPQTSNPKPQTLNPKPQTPNLKPQTPNLKPQTPNPKPQTPNPKPQTPNPKLKVVAMSVEEICSDLAGRGIDATTDTVNPEPKILNP